MLLIQAIPYDCHLWVSCNYHKQQQQQLQLQQRKKKPFTLFPFISKNHATERKLNRAMYGISCHDFRIMRRFDQGDAGCVYVFNVAVIVLNNVLTPENACRMLISIRLTHSVHHTSRPRPPALLHSKRIRLYLAIKWKIYNKHDTKILNTFHLFYIGFCVVGRV